METTYEERLLKERYCVDGENNWEQIVSRVVNSIIPESDKQRKELTKQMMLNKDFLPNSPTLMNAGTNSGQLAACFVLPIEDSIHSIFEAVKNAAIIHKSGGGTGFSFSSLRPSGSLVNSTKGVASGVVSFLEVFDAATQSIKQGGKRRGANMGVLHYTHPEIRDFITCKQIEGKIKNFNLSVMVDDKFMNHISQNPHGNSDMNELFNTVVDGIYKNGEPGILFEDAINSVYFTKQFGKMSATNPCGEQPLYPGESCTLASINLVNMVSDQKLINWNKLDSTVRAAVWFLDDVITTNKYPLEEIENKTKLTRKIGLGIMGYHDMLIKMGIPYDDPEAFKAADNIMSTIQSIALEESANLTNYRDAVVTRDEEPMRNVTVTTIAPTGTISILANGVSSGIEPIFSWVYTRKDTTGERQIIHPLFKEALLKIYPENSVDYNNIIQHAKTFGTIQNTNLPQSFKNLFKSALDISSENHVKMQASFQKHVDNAVSKTINVPTSATKEDIKKVILLAWKLKCKGLTIYRSGSREEEVLCLDKTKVKDNIVDWIDTENAFYESKTPAVIYKVHSGCGKFYVIIGHDKEEPTMIFVEGDGVGGCNANMAAMGRSISAGLEWGTPAENYVKQFSKVKCMTAMQNKLSCGKSCADITGKCMGDAIKMLKPKEIKTEVGEEKCCDNPHYVMQEGCRICTNCGKSRCS